MLLLQPKHRLDHLENYLLSLSRTTISGSEYPKNMLFHYENRSTDRMRSPRRNLAQPYVCGMHTVWHVHSPNLRAIFFHDLIPVTLTYQRRQIFDG